MVSTVLVSLDSSLVLVCNDVGEGGVPSLGDYGKGNT